MVQAANVVTLPAAGNDGHFPLSLCFQDLIILVQSSSIKYSSFKASSSGLGVKPMLVVLALNGCRADHVCNTRPAPNVAVHLIISGVEALSKVMYMVYLIPANM